MKHSHSISDNPFSSRLAGKPKMGGDAGKSDAGEEENYSKAERDKVITEADRKKRIERFEGRRKNQRDESTQISQVKKAKETLTLGRSSWAVNWLKLLRSYLDCVIVCGLTMMEFGCRVENGLDVVNPYLLSVLGGASTYLRKGRNSHGSGQMVEGGLINFSWRSSTQMPSMDGRKKD
ncbi:hypothetical protein GQ457_09G020800 [Hibiscus cannabinus]